MNRPRIIAIFLTLSALSAAGLGHAQSGPGGQGGQGKEGGRPHGPPPEAIAACKDKSADATCSFTGREGQSLTGTCFAPPKRENDSAAKPLACRPAGAPRGPDKAKGNG